MLSRAEQMADVKRFPCCSLRYSIRVSPSSIVCGERTPRTQDRDLFLENDIFRGTDREYTNGVKLTWISQDLSSYREDPRVPEWSYPIIEELPFVNEPRFQGNISFSLGQNMYGPEDIQRKEQQYGSVTVSFSY